MAKQLWKEKITVELDEDGIIQAESLKNKLINLGLKAQKFMPALSKGQFKQLNLFLRPTKK